MPSRGGVLRMATSRIDVFAECISLYSMAAVGYWQKYAKNLPHTFAIKTPPRFSQETQGPRKNRGFACYLRLVKIIESTEGGTRTHTSLRTLDFESSASANSATSAQSCYTKAA